MRHAPLSLWKPGHAFSEFIALHADLIVDEWERFARHSHPPPTPSTAQLRDHAHSILLAAARDMDTRQSASEQAAKAKGEGPDKAPAWIRPQPAMASCATPSV
jgi:hypothetical protein